MKILWFEGYSDDTFGMTRAGNDTTHCDDYDNSASGKPIEWLLTSASTGESLLVVGQYAPKRAQGWLIGVSPADESAQELPIPAWPMRIERGEKDYSPRLVIEAPDDVVWRCMQQRKEVD